MSAQMATIGIRTYSCTN